MYNKRIKTSVESIMVILLMIIFAASICLLIFEGSRTYRAIINNKVTDENVRIALSYVNMRIKQNDVEDHILIEANQPLYGDVLTIHHHGDEDGLTSYIYHKDGHLYECYTDGSIDHNLSSEIIPIEGINFRYNTEGSQIVTTITYLDAQSTKDIVQLTTLRTH